MKKRISLLMVLAIILCFMVQTSIYAYSPHYLPGDVNYLSIDNFEYIGDTEYFTTKEAFLVKPYTSYTLSIERDYGEPSFGEIEVELYDNETFLDALSFESISFEIANVNDIDAYTTTFQTTSSTNYMKITFSDENDCFKDGSFNVQLEEGEEFTGFQIYHEGETIDTSAPYFLNAGTVISYYDSPITVAEIQSSLTAYDAIDGDVSDSITLVSDNYSAYLDTLGTYQCVFSVSDSSQNSEEVTVSIELVDALSPVFTELETIQAVYPNVYTVDNILDMLSASDNYDGDLSNQIVLVNDGYSLNSSICGSYEMEFKVTDSSGNNTTYIQSLEVVDNEGPIISGITEIVVGYDTLLTEKDITNNLTCTDNYDDQEILELVLESNLYTENYNNIGIYEMVYSVTDSNGNKTLQTISIEVVDEIGPAIYLDYSIIQTYTDTVLGLPDFAQILVNTNEIYSENNYSVTVKYDSYTRNSSIPGTYHLKLDFEDENGDVYNKDFEIRVVDRPVDYIYDENTLIEPEESIINGYKDYIIGGILSACLLISNVVWVVVFKKKH